ncbi:DNA-binding protein [Kitasatospora sp. NPDC050543]|uniref:DNA-binding protein n=1 Tax=Kitasatospora sp. NPDC050543 TaxID=3364054 RepID=UPI00379B981E
MFVTTGQAGTALGCSIPTVKKLMATGAVPGIADRGRQVFPLTALQALQRLPAADLTALKSREVAVLRADAPALVEEDDRQWTGYGATLAERELLAALIGWWRCAPQRVATPGVLPVTVAGFVVAVLTNLDEWQTRGTGPAARHRFAAARLAGYLTDLTHPVNAAASASADDRRLADLLLGTRLHSVSGGPIAYVPTRPAEPPAASDQGGASEVRGRVAPQQQR